MINNGEHWPTSRAKPLVEPLKNRRRQRYDGGGLDVELSDFSSSNRAAVEALYQLVVEFEERLKSAVLGDEAVRETLDQVIDETSWREVGGAVRDLSSTLEDGEDVEARARALHDIRGGAWTGLWSLLQFVSATESSRSITREAFWLARDHAKMMRNAVRGIDVERATRDRTPKMHGIELIVEKWQSETSRGELGLEVDVHCQFEGAIAERCLEFSALDRVLYNLLNNARRHAVDSRADLWILPAPRDRARDVRFVVSNGLTLEDKQHIDEMSEGAGSLFLPGVSSTGSGLGLSIATEFVTNAYGLDDASRTVEDGYVGVEVEGQRVNIWVHWPIVD